MSAAAKSKPKPEPKLTVSVQLSPEAKDLADQMVARSGMTQRALVQRVFAWLAEQPAEIQGIVLGHIPDTLARLTIVRSSDPDSPSG